LAAALACGKFGPGDLSRTIAIEITAPDSLEEYDTITPHARLLDGRGDPVAATIAWSLPDSADTVALTLIDTNTGTITVNHTGLVTTDTVTTGAPGIAFVKVRLLGPPVPDSVVVQAIARRAGGDTVPGSPVSFVVRFRP